MSSSRRRLRSASLVVVVLAISTWWMSVPTPPEAGPRPSETSRGRRLIAATQAPPPSAADHLPADASAADNEPVVLHVPAGIPGRVEFVPEHQGFAVQSTFSFVDVSPTRALPRPDEAPWPDHPVMGELQEPITDVEALLASAEDAGALDPDSVNDTPWTALVGLRVLHAVSEARLAVARQQWQDAYPRPDAGDYPDAAAYRAARMARGRARPRLDSTPVQDLAERILEEAPDHPVADYARLFLLDAVEVNGVTGAGAEDLGEVGTEILLESTDPLVLDTAALKLAAVSGGTALSLPAPALDVLARIHDGMGPGRGGSVAEVGLRAALVHGDVALVEQWTERFDAELAARDCAAAPPGSCEAYQRELSHALGWVAATRGVPGATWAADLYAAALRCARAHDIPDPALTGHGTFAGQWRWGSWSAAGALSTCIADAELRGPAPGDGQPVVLHVFEARRR